ncbi:MAG: glycosyltransferase family 4 protein [Candidatus Helarchaeota archaeon]
MNEPLPDLAKELGVPAKIGGGWMVALSKMLAKEPNVELGVASRITDGTIKNVKISEINHFTIKAHKKIGGIIYPTNEMVQRYKEIVSQFKPDIIHVHGTEWYAGLVTMDNRLETPVVVSIQGLLDYSERYFLGDLGFSEILKSRTLKEWIFFRGLWEQKRIWQRRAIAERKIIKGHKYFIGRTLWDRAHLRRLNPNALYFHCDEMVREDFYEKCWDISNINRYTVFSQPATYPLKGFHLLIKAVALLKDDFPGIKVRVPLAGFLTNPNWEGVFLRQIGNGYDNYLFKLIKEKKLTKHIIPLGRLSANEMAEEMQKANVFSINSFVENSPNTLAEALVLGLPCVVSLTGGVTSIIKDNVSALGFPIGDETLLAEQIRRIFLDDHLAQNLSKKGREKAELRYSKDKIVKRMIEIYHSVILK